MEEHGINSATFIVHSVKSRDSITWSQDSTDAEPPFSKTSVDRKFRFWDIDLGHFKKLGRFFPPEFSRKIKNKNKKNKKCK